MARSPCTSSGRRPFRSATTRLNSFRKTTRSSRTSPTRDTPASAAAVRLAVDFVGLADPTVQEACALLAAAPDGTDGTYDQISAALREVISVLFREDQRQRGDDVGAAAAYHAASAVELAFDGRATAPGVAIYLAIKATQRDLVQSSAVDVIVAAVRAELARS